MALSRIDGCGWRLIFVPGLMMNFYDLPRCVDFRKSLPGSNNFKKGQRIYGHFLDAAGECIELEVLEDTKVLPFAAIPPEIRNEWGLPARGKTSLLEMFSAMKGYYSDLTLKNDAAINFLRFARDSQGKIIRHEFPKELRERTEFILRGKQGG